MYRYVTAAVLALLPAVARAEWQEATSPHFVVYSDDSPDKVKAFTTKLERFDKAMRVMRDVPDSVTSPSSRVTIFVVRNIGEVQRLAGRGGGGIAGFEIPRASGSVAFVPRRSGDGGETALKPDAILFHEYAHHWMFSTMGNAAVPAWLVEGFAEFNATATVADSGEVQVGLPPLYRAYGITDSSLMPMQRLLTADPNRLPDMARSVFYGRAWLLTHYLTLSADGRKLLAAYLTAINDGKSAVDAAKLLGDASALDRKLNVYAMRKMIKVFPIAAASLSIGTVTVRALTPAEAAVMPARIRSTAGVDKRTAPTVAALARTEAAAYPNDAAAQNELAEAEFDAGNLAASAAAADRAIAAAPRSVHALIYRGMAEEAQVVKSSADPARWREVRHWFTRANAVDHDDPWPLVAFYGSFVAAHQTPTTNAETGLISAHDLAPFDGSLSLEVARIYLRRGKVEEARLALKPVAYNPHGGPSAALATQALAALDGPGASAALALVTAPKDDAAK